MTSRQHLRPAMRGVLKHALRCAIFGSRSIVLNLHLERRPGFVGLPTGFPRDDHHTLYEAGRELRLAKADSELTALGVGPDSPNSSIIRRSLQPLPGPGHTFHDKN